MTKAEKYTVLFEPSGLKTEVSAASTLLDAAHKVGIYVSSICGGDGYCGKCKVVIDKGQFKSRPNTLLTDEEVNGNVVLACQTKILSDMTVTIPVWHHLDTSQILTSSDTSHLGKVKTTGFKLDPLVKKLYIEMSPPTVSDHTADHERMTLAVKEQVKTPTIKTSLHILQKLFSVLKDSDYKITATIGRRNNVTEIIDIEAGNQCQNYAIAVDIGTTTVVAHLIDLGSAQTIDTKATYNSQINLGEDYIRRIIYGEENDAFDKLQNLIVNDINNLIAKLVAKQKIDAQNITACICAGNTAMIHFLLNLDPTRIRREPYVASAAFISPIRAAKIGIKINKRGLLYCLPGVAAYVGSDIVAGVLATRLYTKKGISLLVDIGTNGEIVLGNKEWIVCASSSAGPAFEGSGIKNGTRAGIGAIEKLTIQPDGTISYKTIGDSHPIGICGSGLLDTLAELLTHGLIDRTGKFGDDSDQRLSHGQDGIQFQLVPAFDNYPEIVITQADINNLIRSKAGVFAAIRVLMDSTQTKPENIDTVFLAGGFGNFLNTKQAVTIGMLPDIPIEKIQFVGNTAIAGAKAAMLSLKALETAEQIAHNMTYFDLMNHPTYMEEFIRASFLPHTDLSLFPSADIKNKR